MTASATPIPRPTAAAPEERVMGAYYNEIDPFAARWLRNLITAGHIAPGDVDDRSITDVRPDDLTGYTQCHFFAGIGGWSYAARLAGWPDDEPLWTGSCPCQPFSEAGHGGAFDDARHLWPQWFRLIRECRPPVLFGEQVPEAVRHGWLDAVSDDLEAEGYAIGAAVLPACAVGAPHLRDRLWFLAYSASERREPFWWQQLSQGGAEARPIHQWPPEPPVARMADGVRNRMALVRGFGNAIVPQVAAEILGAWLDARFAA